MDCVTVRDTIHDYAAGAVDPGTKAEISRHLEECPQCRLLLKQTKAYYAAIRRSRQAIPPADFIEQTMERIRHPRSRWRELVSTLFLPLKIKIPLEALGVVMVSVVILILYRPGSYLGQSPVAPAQNAAETDHPAVDRTSRPTIQRVKSAREDSVSESAPGVMLARDEERAREIDDAGTVQSESTAMDTAKKHVPGKIIIALNLHHTVEKNKTDATEYRSGMPSKSVGGSSSFYGGAVPSEEKSAKSEGPVQKMKGLVARNSGKIVKSTNNAPGSDSFLIELPRDNYESFLKELRGMGEMIEKSSKQPAAADRIILDMNLK